MSREDPQFKLRMPLELRNRAEQSANAAGRSLNAELVARLEASYISELPSDYLISAKRAKELAAIARTGIPDEIRNRTYKAINKAISLGHSSASVDLRDLKLDGGLTDEEADELVSSINKELSDAGYNFEWDGAAWLWIRF
ncbi:TPA: Arc family DNA-binding protein [Pseudomonas aeruginosa]|uniref:Arc family DNA-binding protein n=1 Tax=Pseudomonas aeruginosa TaxID=287 RepID=UPI0009A38EF7|nr:Arc family DNA-binding protein [Pseudomonas aeruginosa]HEP9528335.1 Arc family DNA-binding protein [Pseudomonas aeruginosa]HEP9531074.1 Arc family DNA-binding protein [Pseudomonas aeruginosa]